jgi:hypothetical protein
MLSGFAHDQPVPLDVAMEVFASALKAAGCDAKVEHPHGEPTILIERSDGRVVPIEIEGAQEYADWDEYRTGGGSYGNYVAFTSDE